MGADTVFHVDHEAMAQSRTALISFVLTLIHGRFYHFSRRRFFKTFCFFVSLDLPHRREAIMAEALLDRIL